MGWVFEDEEDLTRGGSIPMSDILRGPMGPIGPVGERPMSIFGNFNGPELPGRTEDEITQEGSKIRRDFIKQPLEAAQFIPGPGPLMARLATQGALGAGIETAEGGNPLIGLAKGAGFQGAGELLNKGVGTAKGLAQGLAEPTERLVKFLQEAVPPLKEITDLGSMIAGKGKRLVQDMVQQSEDKLIAKAGDMTIPLQVKDIEALGLKSSPPANPMIDPRQQQMVDASDLIKAIKGHAKPDERDLYNRIMSVLESVGLKDESVHAAYKNYMGIRDFLEATGALKGNRLDVAKLRQGLQNTKIQDETIGWRGMGNAEEGPLANSIQGIKALDLKGPLGTIGGGVGLLAGAATHMPHAAWAGSGIGSGLLGSYLGSKIGPLSIREGVQGPIPPQDIAALLRYLLSQ